MERSGKPGPFLAVLKVRSLPPSPSGKSKLSLRQSAPFAAPVGLDGFFPVQREGSSLPLTLPKASVSELSTRNEMESRFSGGVESRSLTPFVVFAANCSHFWPLRVEGWGWSSDSSCRFFLERGSPGPPRERARGETNSGGGSECGQFLRRRRCLWSRAAGAEAGRSHAAGGLRESHLFSEV